MGSRLLLGHAGLDVDIEEIKRRVANNQYAYSQHAEIERRAEALTLTQVEDAVLNGEILEQYPDTGRGESCLVVGFAAETPVHIVCGWRGEAVVFVTIYVPRPPKFIDPWTRGG